MLNLGMNLQRLAAKQVEFTPASLFNKGEAGVWYDPSAASGSLDWRRNLLEYTESFDNSAWSKSGVTITANNETAPDGTQTADTVVFANTYGSSIIRDYVATLASTYTFSFYAKASSAIQIGARVGSANTSFTLSTEWQRFTLSASVTADASTIVEIRGGVVSGVTAQIWGAQLEEASTASSYQPILSTFENAFKAAFPSHTLYQDYQGVTPVTAVGEPVGLMLDKSKGLAQGPELVTNGDFATDSGWSKGTGWTIANGNAAQSGGVGQLAQAVSIAVGVRCRFTFTVVIQAGTLRISAGPTAPVKDFSESGTYTFDLPFSGSAVLYFLGTSSSFVGSIDNVSVTEIQGSHATQPTSTKRPIYARHPEGGIRNLLNYTEQFDNSAWAKISTGGAAVSVIPSSYAAPDGTYSATQVLGLDTANSRLDQTTVLPALANKTYTYSVWLRGSGVIKINMGTSSGVGGSTEVTVTLTSTWTRHDATTTYNSSPTGNVRIHGVITRVTGTAPEVHMWSPQLEEATEASNYQKVVTDIDVTESGVGEVYYLKFDGTDDGMSINNLTSTSTPLTALFGYSATNAESTNLRYLLDIQSGRTVFAVSTDFIGHVGYYDGAFKGFDTDADSIKVLTYDLVEDDAKIRIDGTQEYSDTTYNQKAIGGDIGLFENIYSAGGFVKGNMYQTILRAAESTDEEIAKAETFVANKTGLKAQVDGIATLDLNFGANTYTAKNSNGGVI